MTEATIDAVYDALISSLEPATTTEMFPGDKDGHETENSLDREFFDSLIERLKSLNGCLLLLYEDSPRRFRLGIEMKNVGCFYVTANENMAYIRRNGLREYMVIWWTSEDVEERARQAAGSLGDYMRRAISTAPGESP
jgi:hypothetical protein